MKGTITTAVGEFHLQCDAEGLRTCGTQLTYRKRYAEDDKDDSAAARAHLQQSFEALRDYFEGRRQSFDDLTLHPFGTEFQRAVWRGLCEIPFGETRSYGELARQVGRPRAARAVGAANHWNPISIIQPCHRVLGADGSLTGYAGGVQMKAWLLHHEQSLGTNQPGSLVPGLTNRVG